MQGHMILWWPGKSRYSLAGKFWFIHCIHQTLQLHVFIYFCLYKILLMEKIPIPWTTVKGTGNSSLFKEIKVLGWWYYEFAWKMAVAWGTKWWIHFSIKFLVKIKKKCVTYFCLKIKGSFWTTQIFTEDLLTGKHCAKGFIHVILF